MANYLHKWTKSQVLGSLLQLNGDSRKRKRSLSAPPSFSRPIFDAVYEDPLRCVMTDANSEENDSIPFEIPAKRQCMHNMKNWVVSLDSTKYKIYHDPVHGPIELHPLLVSIINTRAFDRLKDIKQLGGAYYVYPGATHSRFEHSLGTCYIAGEYIRMLKRKQPELGITDKDVLHIQIAALCRNLGHGPFSNLFKNEVLPRIYPEIPKELKVPMLSGLILQHHIYTDKKVKEEFKKYGIDEYDIEIIKELIDHTIFDPSNLPVLHDPKRAFLCEIVANNDTGIDVAKWDYLARDCHYLGIPNEFNWRRLMALSRVIKVDGAFKICYRDKEINNVYGMFRTRCNLFERVYKHHSVVAVEHMIGDAILKAMKSNLVEFESQTGQSLTSIRSAIDGINNDPPDLEGYLGLTDSIVPIILNASSETELEGNEDDNDPKSNEENVNNASSETELEGNEDDNDPKSDEESVNNASSETKLEGNEDDNDPKSDEESVNNASSETELEGNEDDNDPKSDEESVNNPDTVGANDYNDYSLEKAKKILWRLKQRDLLDLIDEVDSTETEKITKNDLADYRDDEDVYIITVEISCDTEMKCKENPAQDPVERVYFYDKESPWKAIKTPWETSSSEEPSPKRSRSKFVILKTFVSKKTRLYVSRNKNEDDRKKIKGAFNEAVARANTH